MPIYLYFSRREKQIVQQCIAIKTGHFHFVVVKLFFLGDLHFQALNIIGATGWNRDEESGIVLSSWR
jgi:hypothetical protein